MFSNNEYHELAQELVKAKADAGMFAHLTVVLGRRVAELESDLYRLLEGEPPPEPDYEALGYPETDFSAEVDPDSLAGVVIVLHRWLHSMTGATDKENQDDVDNG